MAVITWFTMGLALWHFTVFVPDRFWGGIVGAFLSALAGAMLFGFLIHGLGVPSREDTTVVTALEAIPGAIIGMALCWYIGSRRPQPEDAVLTQPGTPAAR